MILYLENPKGLTKGKKKFLETIDLFREVAGYRNNAEIHSFEPELLHSSKVFVLLAVNTRGTLV